MIKRKEKIYGERGRRWRASVEPSWFKRNIQTIVIAVCIVFAISLYYFVHKDGALPWTTTTTNQAH